MAEQNGKDHTAQQKPRRIPQAQLPAGGPRSHVAAMRQDMIRYIEALADQGPLLRIPLLGPLSAYFVNDADLVRDVLVRQANAFHKPGNVKRAARDLKIENIFTADDALWQALRKVEQPAFHAARIARYAALMQEETERMIAAWRPGDRLDTPAAMADVTLAIVTRALFGKDMRDAAASAAIVRFIELFYQRISGISLPGWLPTRANREAREQLATIEAWLAPLIADRRAAPDPAAYDDVLGLLIAAQRVDDSGLLTDHQVRTEVMNLFVAGYEVVAHTLAFTLYLVATHDLVASGIQRELDEVAAAGPLSPTRIAQLSYLDQVLKESMRLLPVTTVLTRETVRPVTLGGYRLPARRMVLFSPWGLQRSARYFSDPLLFRPARFHAESGDDFHRYAYLPFSAGPRVCLGSSFAMLQMKITLAVIWRRFSFSHPDDHRFALAYSFNTRPRNGLPLLVSLRDNGR